MYVIMSVVIDKKLKIPISIDLRFRFHFFFLHIFCASCPSSSQMGKCNHTYNFYPYFFNGTIPRKLYIDSWLSACIYKKGFTTKMTNMIHEVKIHVIFHANPIRIHISIEIDPKRISRLYLCSVFIGN